MKEIPTKRGRVTFGTEKVMMEESWTGYVRNSYRGFMKRGGLLDKLFFTLTVAFLSAAMSFMFSVYFVAPLQAQINAALMMLVIAFAIYVYEHWNNVKKEKFIKYSEIESVELIEGFKPFTCPRFVITYERNGSKSIRYITMPIELMPGVDKDIDDIIEAFDENGVEVEV